MIIKKNGTLLLTDYIEYEKNTKLFKSKGNIKFFNENQIFTSDYFENNFSDNPGFIENIYGLIDLETFSEDINLRKNNLSDSKNLLDGLENPTLENRNFISLSFKSGNPYTNILNFTIFDPPFKGLDKEF